MTTRPIRTLAHLKLLAVLCLALASPVSAAPGDEAILAASDAFRVRDPIKLARAASAARGHVLEPYVEYWQLALKLDAASPDDIRSFLQRHARSYLAERLRGEWLRTAGRQGQWEAVAAEYPNLVNEDVNITCWAMQARWRQGDRAALTEVRPVWNAPRDLPEGCVPLAEALIASGELTVRHVWERARLLWGVAQLSATNRVLGYLPEAERPDAKTIEQLFANPQRYLDKATPDYSTRKARELSVLALTRLAATKDSATALGYFSQPLQAKLSAEDRAFIFSQLALQSAKRHLPEAIAWFDESEAMSHDGLSDEQLAWWVRIALREGQWPGVKKAIDRMGAIQKNDSAWIYWLGRAQRELGELNDAQASFARIAGEHHFYGQLAADEVGARFIVPAKSYAPTAAEMITIAKDAGLTRALALFRLEMRSEAVREWNWSIRGWDDKQLLAAAELARRNEIWDRAINTADRTVALHDFSVRFLAPYRSAFSSYSQSAGLEEPWVLGLVRQESRFIAGARSVAGASGLMQLMPATARLVANKVGMRDFKWGNVTDVDVNVQLGTSYLRQVLDRLDGHPVLASAAYNAGPGRAQRWRADRPLDGAIYAESIPFSETRDYVKKVLSNTVYYDAALVGGEPRTLKSRLGMIPPRGAETAEKVMATFE